MPREKTPIYLCQSGAELRGKTCYVNSGAHEYATADSEDADRPLPSLTMPRESDAPDFGAPTQQQIESCGFDTGCVDALIVAAGNAYNRAAELWDARMLRFWQELDRQQAANERVWVCMHEEDWLKRLSGEDRHMSNGGVAINRCHLAN